MTSKHELAFLVGLAVLGFGAGHVIRCQLLAVRNACEVTRTESPECKSNQRTEDAIKLETLDELSRNPNDEIRNAATRIIIERASKSSSCHMLLRDLRSKSNERRDKAITSINYLFQAVPGCFDAYKNTAIQSMVHCLSNLLPLSLHFETARMEGQEIHRTETERNALELMYLFLLRFGVQIALDCNILSLWLEKYPFGGNLERKHPGDKDSQLAARHRLINRQCLGQARDPAMFRVLNRIMTNSRAMKTMFKHEPYVDVCPCIQDDGETDDDEQGLSEIWYEVHGTANVPDPGWGPMMRRGNRVREESVEEQALRRRRREAMVLGEMGRPIESEDIIQRVGTYGVPARSRDSPLASIEGGFDLLDEGGWH
ncbi:MAG: hypothetical protein LQ349_006849 [Xanthoria aureola]|nr:MAG: hypothetical protein LQ349_006849 [Xanthoria aureola]